MKKTIIPRSIKKSDLCIAFLFSLIVFAVGQQKEKTVQLPAVTVNQFNVVMQALQECDCPVKSTPALMQSFVNAAKTQQPEWFGIKPDSSKTKKP